MTWAFLTLPLPSSARAFKCQNRPEDIGREWKQAKCHGVLRFVHFAMKSRSTGKPSRDLARWLYRQLEAEYDHLTSDETVEDGIIANEYTFTAGGRRFG